MSGKEKTDWSTPKEATMLDVAFPANVIGKLLPPWDEIPEQFKSSHHPMAKAAAKWFFQGLKQGTSFVLREGVDGKKATMQVQACLGSFEPKHEHKEAGVAYLMNSFFDRIELEDGTIFERTPDEPTSTEEVAP